MSVYVYSRHAMKTGRGRHRRPRDTARLVRGAALTGLAILAGSAGAATVFLAGASAVLGLLAR